VVGLAQARPTTAASESFYDPKNLNVIMQVERAKQHHMVKLLL